jgi:hypothetical protein
MSAKAMVAMQLVPGSSWWDRRPPRRRRATDAAPRRWRRRARVRVVVLPETAVLDVRRAEPGQVPLPRPPWDRGTAVDPLHSSADTRPGRATAALAQSVERFTRNE